MNPEQVKELIELISKSDFETFELERGDFKLKLVKPAAPAPPPVAAAPAGGAAPAPGPSAGAGGAPVPSSPAVPEPAPAAAVDPSLVEVKSPIVGTFYSSPNPDSPPFVEAGKRVKTGQTLCIVEAMKVMNEIESEHDGEIVEVLVTNGQPVEFGESIFLLRPA